MNTENVWIVVLLVIGIVLLSNLAMFAMVRGMNFDWFKNMRGSLNTPFKKEDDSLDELRKRVEELQKPKEEE